MKSRDEIIDEVKQLRFSSRECFWSILDQLATIRLESGEMVKVRWPHALGVLTLEQWNEAYTVSMEMCADMVGYTAPGAQPVQ